MVSLRNFNRDDCLFIATKLYPDKTMEAAEALVRKNNHASLRLHEKCGYRIVGECITSRGNEACVLEREL